MWPARPPAACPQFAPTRPGFLHFMGESKVVYEAFEEILDQAAVPYCEPPPAQLRALGCGDATSHPCLSLRECLGPAAVGGLAAAPACWHATAVPLPPALARAPAPCRQAADQHWPGAVGASGQGHCVHAAAVGHGGAGGCGGRPRPHLCQVRWRCQAGEPRLSARACPVAPRSCHATAGGGACRQRRGLLRVCALLRILLPSRLLSCRRPAGCCANWRSAARPPSCATTTTTTLPTQVRHVCVCVCVRACVCVCVD